LQSKGDKEMKKHKWVKDSKDIDIFAYIEGEYHNGPKCSVCGFGFCHHCYPGGYDTSCPHDSLNSDDGKLDSGLVNMIKSIKFKN